MSYAETALADTPETSVAAEPVAAEKPDSRYTIRVGKEMMTLERALDVLHGPEHTGTRIRSSREETRSALETLIAVRARGILSVGSTPVQIMWMQQENDESRPTSVQS